MTIGLLYWVTCLSAWIYAVRFGGNAARWSCIGYILATVGTIAATPGSHLGGMVGLPSISAWRGLNAGLFASDVCYFALLYTVAMRSDRGWPIWSAGIQLFAVLTHFGPMIDPRANAGLYRALEGVCALPLLATMVLGIAKDRKAAGHD